MIEVEYLSELAAATVVLGFAGSMFSFVVTRPLNNAIKDLQGAVQELRSDIREAKDQRHKLEIHVAELEQSARSAHHRINEIVDMLHDR